MVLSGTPSQRRRGIVESILLGAFEYSLLGLAGSRFDLPPLGAETHSCTPCPQ